MSINTNQLKKFAQNTRNKLLQQVGARLDYILSVDSAEMRDVADIVKRLQQDIDRTSREEVIDQVAYTWFNRLTALRYMDLHDYQPLGLRIISGRDGSGEAEIYQAALRHQLPAELEVDRERISQLITGHIASRNPHNEIMSMLLVAACQNLSKIMPFLFERINGYTELLLPEDLLSDQSILADFRKGMTEANAREVEVIGWLYQFYISEKKDAVFASKGKVSKEEIPAATQLFTPRWIVEYMVQNTVGKLWVINNPNSRLHEHMPYYIESEVSQEDILAIHSPEELTLLDQACGSGHILVYGFELFHRIYEEAGHAPSEIPGLIIRHNLRGFEIDPRAAQLAALAITLKAREYQRRYFRKSEVPAPHITCFQDLTLSEDEITGTLHAWQVDPTEELIHDLKLMPQAAQFGSLILPRSSVGELEQLTARCAQVLQSNDLFLINRVERLKYALTTLVQLSQKYACVVDNPPYMGSGNMNKELSSFVKTQYPESKADLMACFMEAGLASLQEKGLLGMINQHSWMFLSSYEKLRIKLIEHSFIDTLLHL